MADKRSNISEGNLAALFNTAFVVIQRYNRPRIIRLLERDNFIDDKKGVHPGD